MGALVEDFNRMLVEIEQQDSGCAPTRRNSSSRLRTGPRSSLRATGSSLSPCAGLNATPSRLLSSPLSGSSCSHVTAPRRFASGTARPPQAVPGGLGCARRSARLRQCCGDDGDLGCDTPPSQRVFGPDECWGFRRGRPHLVEERESPLRCAHLTAEDGPFLDVRADDGAR